VVEIATLVDALRRVCGLLGRKRRHDPLAELTDRAASSA
jgi:hypothetical protein